MCIYILWKSISRNKHCKNCIKNLASWWIFMGFIFIFIFQIFIVFFINSFVFYLTNSTMLQSKLNFFRGDNYFNYSYFNKFLHFGWVFFNWFFLKLEMSLKGTSENEHINYNKNRPIVHPRLSIFEVQEEFDRGWCRYFMECVRASRETHACVAGIPRCACSDSSLVQPVAALRTLKHFVIIETVQVLPWRRTFPSFEINLFNYDNSNNYTIYRIKEKKL